MIKVSNKTPVLIILFIMTSIAGMLYSPWITLYDDIDIEVEVEIILYVSKFIFTVISPVTKEYLDYIECMTYFDKGMSMQYIFAVLLKTLVYILVIHMIEKYHANKNISQPAYIVCINMHCLEGISMYLLNIIFYMLGKFLEILIKNDLIFKMINNILAFFTLYMLFAMLAYFYGGMIITLLFPLFLSGCFMAFELNVCAVICFVVTVIIGRIIWNKLSNRFFNLLCNLKVFTMYRDILSFFDFDLFI